MSLEMCVLGSGSSGNATVLRTPRGVMLIDAGFGPRATQSRLIGTGVCLKEIRAICLTHLDRDHFSPNWRATAIKQGIRIYCHASCEKTLRKLLHSGDDADDLRHLNEIISTFDGEPFEPLPGLALHPIRLAHDAEGSHGFRVSTGELAVGYATDLGRVPDELVEHFLGVDLLALESNYDPDMQLASSRPWYLKQRIMGGKGHLSNAQALAAVQAIFEGSERRFGRERCPRHVVLLHRSRQCNCPNLLHSLFSRDPRIASVLTLAHQYERTEWLRVKALGPLPGEQLAMAWS